MKRLIPFLVLGLLVAVQASSTVTYSPEPRNGWKYERWVFQQGVHPDPTFAGFRDTYINSGATTTNYASDSLAIWTWTSPEKWALVDIDGLNTWWGDDFIPIRAWLWLALTGQGSAVAGQDSRLDVHRMMRQWDENCTWVNRRIGPDSTWTGGEGPTYGTYVGFYGNTTEGGLSIAPYENFITAVSPGMNLPIMAGIRVASDTDTIFNGYDAENPTEPDFLQIDDAYFSRNDGVTGTDAFWIAVDVSEYIWATEEGVWDGLGLAFIEINHDYTSTFRTSEHPKPGLRPILEVIGIAPVERDTLRVTYTRYLPGSGTEGGIRLGMR